MSISLPNIFAYCNTYDRPQCVANIIQMWEAMEYAGDHHLLILDDGWQYRDQPSGDRWEIVSIKRRLASLGEKANFACSLSRPEHDLLVVVEDDDYLAPWTLQAHADAFKRGPISIPKWFFVERKSPEKLRLHHNKRLLTAHAGWACSRDVFRRISGYPWISIPHDHNLRLRFNEVGYGFADSTENFPPYLVSRLLTADDQHLSKLQSSGDPWEDMERELQPVKDLPIPSAANFNQLIHEHLGFGSVSDSLSMAMMQWKSMLSKMDNQL